MASKFEELMANYGKVKQFPLSEQLPPSADKPASPSLDRVTPKDPALRQTIPLEAVLQKYLKKGE